MHQNWLTAFYFSRDKARENEIATIIKFDNFMTLVNVRSRVILLVKIKVNFLNT